MSAVMRSLTQASIHVRPHPREEARMAAAARPARYGTAVPIATCSPDCCGMSTLSTSGIVRYGGTRLAKVVASASTVPIATIRQYGPAKLSTRISAANDPVVIFFDALGVRLSPFGLYFKVDLLLENKSLRAVLKLSISRSTSGVMPALNFQHLRTS